MGPTELWFMVSKILGIVAHNRQSDPRFRRGVDYSVWHVLKVILFCQVYRISLPLFERKRRSQKGFLHRYGLPNRTISRSQVYKRLGDRRVVWGLAELLSQSAARALRSMRALGAPCRVVAMDLTRIESDSDRDPWGRWGFDSKGGFYGYKLGLITSEHGVVLGMTFMRANWNEFRAQRRLIRLAHDVVRSAQGEIALDYLVCDSGFDGEPVYREAHRWLRCPALCPPRRLRNPKAKHAADVLQKSKSLTPHRYRDQEILRTSAEAQAAYKLRTGIERVNGQLKDDGIRIAEIPNRRRGVRRMLPITLAKLVIYNLALNVNIAKGNPIRQIKQLVA
jgi:hypothetical protein